MQFDADEYSVEDEKRLPLAEVTEQSSDGDPFLEQSLPPPFPFVALIVYAPCRRMLPRCVETALSPRDCSC